MKSSYLSTYFRTLLTGTLLAGGAVILPVHLLAAETDLTSTNALAVEHRYASPDEAIKALQTAATAKDSGALQEIFGPDFKEMLTGDKVQDANNAKGFAAAMEQGCNQVKDGDNKITLEVGTNNWPLPIPLVKTDDGQWHFDTAAGKDEIINRHIGKDELCAIGVCRAYVTAQKQFASLTPGANGAGIYAQHFKSTLGKKDGLYWPVAANEAASPFGPLVAEAHAEGYAQHKGAGPHPFHGYYFKILTRQGEAAPGGKMDYLSDGKLTGGFALVAYPVQWDQSGVMTFIVNEDGKVYQQNLGENTWRAAAAIKEYNPDGQSTLVQDEGEREAVLEK